MTDKQRAAMKAINDSTAVRSAIYIRNYCNEHKTCDGCVFDNRKAGSVQYCLLNRYDPSLWKEVGNEILHSEIHEV